MEISIHAPREGGDVDAASDTRFFSSFQSTPPARGATRHQRCDGEVDHISIHAPREGGDPRASA